MVVFQISTERKDQLSLMGSARYIREAMVVAVGIGRGRNSQEGLYQDISVTLTWLDQDPGYGRLAQRQRKMWRTFRV